MSQGGGGGGGGGHHQYRTQSDTLKLQRLIEVLKQRGSDLAGSLESSAADFLTDVKTPAARAAAEKSRQEDNDDGSSFEGSDYDEHDINSPLHSNTTDSLKTPLLPISPPVSEPEILTQESKSEVSAPDMPREGRRDTTASMVAVAAATAAAPAVADVLQIPHEAMIRRRVHFEGIPDQSDSQSPTPTASEASASPLPSSPLPPTQQTQTSQPSSSESGGTIITELVRKSSEVLNLLTMSMVDTDSNKGKQQVTEQVAQNYVGEDNSSSHAATFDMDSSSSSPSSSEYEDDFDDDDCEVDDEVDDDDVIDSSCNVPYARFDKNDPPDPRELAKLHNRKWKKKPTMALKWRRQRERTRLLMQQDQ